MGSVTNQISRSIGEERVGNLKVGTDPLDLFWDFSDISDDNDKETWVTMRTKAPKQMSYRENS